MYGKFFEKLVLGGVLHTLGLRLVQRQNVSDTDEVFWLSERGERRDRTVWQRQGRPVLHRIHRERESRDHT